MGTIKSVDDLLDDLAIRALHLMQEVVNTKLKLQELVKDGSINLAKSRYIMGNRSISCTQLPTKDSSPFHALSTVSHSKSVDDADDGLSSVYQFTLQRQEPAKKKKSLGGKSEPVSSKEEVSDDMPVSSDPIQWFGVLVPQNLRQAQSSYKKAVELVVEIANLQSQLEATRIQFCILRLEKINLSPEKKS